MSYGVYERMDWEETAKQRLAELPEVNRIWLTHNVDTSAPLLQDLNRKTGYKVGYDHALRRFSIARLIRTMMW